MGSFSNYSENILLNHLTRNSAYTPAASIFLALCTGDPGETATGASMSEVANSGSYARTAVTFSAAASRRVTASADVAFPAASGSWGTVSHWAIVDSNTYGSGNVLAYGAFTVSKSIVSGNTPTFTGSSLFVEFDTSNGFSNYAANAFLDRMFRNQAFTVSANHAGLTTAAPTNASTGSSITEVSGGSYARVAINNSGGGAPAWGTVASGSVNNADVVTFPTSSASWGTITHAVICDASTAGNLLWWGAVTNQAVASGDIVRFAASGITLTST